MAETIVPTVDKTTLTPVVRAILKNEKAEVVEWQSQLIVQGRASSAGVSRIRGTARIENESVPWSLVLKEIYTSSQSVLASNHASDDQSAAFYWKREMLVYQSGLFETLPAGFAAPRCYQLDEFPTGSRLWLEELHDDVGTLWPVEHYRHVARHFGRFNGQYLVDRPLPQWPWLIVNFLSKYVEDSDWPEFAANYAEARHSVPLVQRGWDDKQFAAIDRVWQERARFLTVLNSLPRTLLHNDSGRKNLFARKDANGDFETVAVDWAQPAIGAIGEDLAILLSQPVYWFHGIRPQDMWEVDKIAFASYLQGMADVGWNGDPTLVRLGYTISITLRVSFLVFIFEWAARDENTRHIIERAIVHPAEEIVDAMRGLRFYLMECADEARQLMASRAGKELLAER